MTELKIVCGKVDWPTTTLYATPSSSTVFTSNGSLSLSGLVTPFACCSLNSCAACRIELRFSRDPRLPYCVPYDPPNGLSRLGSIANMLSACDIRLRCMLNRCASESSKPAGAPSSTTLSDVLLPCSLNASRSKDLAASGVFSTSSRVYEGPSSPSSVNLNEGLTGVISKNPAARCHEDAKRSMLLTPPACIMESRRIAIEDLEQKN